MDALLNCRPLCLLGCWVGWVSCGSSWARQPGQPGQSGQKTQSSSVYLYIIRYSLTIKPFLRAPLLCQISKVRIMKIARWLKVLGHFELFFRPATNQNPLLQIETDLPQIEILSFELENKCQCNVQGGHFRKNLKWPDTLRKRREYCSSYWSDFNSRMDI